jgi:hypothetical protein
MNGAPGFIGGKKSNPMVDCVEHGAPDLGGWGWGDAGVGLVGESVEGDEDARGVEGGLDGIVVVTETMVGGVGDDVLVGDGGGTGMVFGFKADGGDGLAEVVPFFLGVFAFGNG